MKNSKADPMTIFHANAEPGGAAPLRRQTERFDISGRLRAGAGGYEIRLRSRQGGRNHAVHTHFNLVADSGDLIERRPLDAQAARFIIDNFEARGDTASFDIFASDLTGSGMREREPVATDPKSIRHQLTGSEQSYTATGTKLAYHQPIFDKYRETGFASIIRATMTLHQVCASKCPYCSTIRRNRADAITLDEAKAFVTALGEDQARYNRDNFAVYNDRYREATGADIGLRGLILSGGGQPNLWPHFAEFVDWLAGLDMDLGLITNGFPPHIDEDIYRHFQWIRLSITPEDASPHYPGQRFDAQYMPETIRHNDALTVGLSYVHGPWTDDDILARIDGALEDNGFDYCRVLADCNLSRSAQLAAHGALAERLFQLGFIDVDGQPLKRIFHQLKYHGEGTEAEELWDGGQCFLQVYNTFWDTTGHEANGHSACYPCDSVTVLAGDEEPERRFDAMRWGTHTNTDVAKLYCEPVRPFFDPRQNCAACLFMRNNRMVKDLSSAGGLEFTPGEPPEHINFP
ncbi:MAG: radical SAM protein [Rhodospirillaceae bacterium]|nr:radical SAM protein [Rhodospirillaceae bacterium]